MNKKTLRAVDVTGKKVLVRVDFNVPMKDGIINDDTRMTKALPTIKYLQEKKAKTILVTHLGRPKGKIVPEMSVKPLVEHLSKLLGKKVLYAQDCGEEDSRTVTEEMKEGQVVLLENARFYPGEEKNDSKMAEALAHLADIYVNDAFGTAHRAHATTEGVAHYLPAVAGFLMEKEIEALSSALENPQKPFVAILGGAKVSDKISVMKNFLNKVEYLLVGGGMANTFLKAAGHETGKSLIEPEKLDVAKEILEKAKSSGVEVILPVDLVVADKFAEDAQSQVVDVDNIPTQGMALDLGPATLKVFEEVIDKAKTIVWNGPLGVYEFSKFAKGTNETARIIAQAEAQTIIGGGDVVAAVEKAGVAEKIYHISTGGGASLEFLEGKSLPGIEALLD